MDLKNCNPLTQNNLRSLTVHQVVAGLHNLVSINF